MALGSLLLRPQSLDAASGQLTDQSLSDMWELFRLMRESGKDGADGWLSMFAEEFESLIKEIVEEVEPGLEKVRDRIGGRVSQWIDQFGDLFGSAEAIGDTAKTLVEGGLILDEIAGLIEKTNTDNILSFFGELLDILEKDLGLSLQRVKSIISDFIDRLVAKLQEAYLAGDTNAITYNTYRLGRQFQKVRDLTSRESELPFSSKKDILNALRPFLDDLNIQKHLEKITGRIKELAEILGPISDLTGGGSAGTDQNAPLRTQARAIIEGLSPRSADEKTCWYASWLHNEPICDDDPIERLRRDKIDFKRIGPEKMEAWAYHTKWIFKWIEILPHVFSIPFDTRNGFSTAGQPQRNFLPNTLNITWQLIDFFLIVLKDYNIHRGWKWLIKPLSSFLGAYALPGFRYSDPYGILIQLLQVAEMQLYARWAYVLREAILSFLTLINHDPDKLGEFRQYISDERDRLNRAEAANGTTDAIKQERERLGTLVHIHNHNQSFGICYLLGEIGAIGFAAGLANHQKEMYGWADGGGTFGVVGDNNWTVGLPFLSTLTSEVASVLLGLPLGGALARKMPDADTWLHTLFKTRIYLPYKFLGVEGGSFLNVLKSIGTVTLDILEVIGFLILSLGDDLLRYTGYLFIFHEGKTNGGRFTHPTLATALGSNFNGYADRTSSPYLLPYETGRVFHCVQGHLGFFSHTPFSVRFQTYAIDFNMNNGDSVLACRSGILWNFTEGLPDGDDGRPANGLNVLHHIPPDPVHDVFVGTTPIRTFGRYIHGRQNSISNAINPALGPNRQLRMVAANNIIADSSNAVAAFAAVGVILSSLGGGQIATIVDTSVTLPSGRNLPIGPVHILQGQKIMEADDTGRSAYNHLHMHINPSTNSAVNTTSPLLSTTLQPDNQPRQGNFSIPFVFRDIGGDGAPKSYIHYEASVSQATILLTAQVSNPGAAAGATVTITINAQNNGPADAINVLVQNFTPPGYTYSAGSIAGTDSANPLPAANLNDASTPYLTWRIDALANGSTAVLTFDAIRTADADVTNIPLLIGRESTE